MYMKNLNLLIGAMLLACACNCTGGEKPQEKEETVSTNGLIPDNSLNVRIIHLSDYSLETQANIIVLFRYRNTCVKDVRSIKGAKKKTSKQAELTISGLKSQKLYYVRVRTYKKVNGKTQYSAWSVTKNITTW